MLRNNYSCAVLFIHGILETPRYFDFLTTAIPKNCKAYFLQPKGNKGSVRDFSAVSMSVWKKQVRAAVKRLLNENQELIIAAHSMGALLAVEEAVKNPSVKLFLINAPLKIQIRSQMLRTCFKIFLDKVKPSDIQALAAKKTYGIEKNRNIFLYFGWIPNYLSLFSEIRYVKGLLKELTSPCLAYFSLNDEMVSAKSAELLKPCPSVKVKLLKESGHYYYSEGDTEILRRDFINMIIMLGG